MGPWFVFLYDVVTSIQHIMFLVSHSIIQSTVALLFTQILLVL